MARTQDHNSATSQFFINVGDHPDLDYPGRDGSGYAVFGKVIAGQEVVDKIKGRARRRHPRPAERAGRAGRDSVGNHRETRQVCKIAFHVYE